MRAAVRGLGAIGALKLKRARETLTPLGAALTKVVCLMPRTAQPQPTVESSRVVSSRAVSRQIGLAESH